MEFYELNRLYDASLPSMDISQSADGLLYSVLPVCITLGCGVSLLTVLVLLHSEFNLTSKNYLVVQCTCNFFFQIVSAVVLITNNYEQDLLRRFSNKPSDYLNFKLLLNAVYNILLYCVLWFFTVGNLDFAVLSIVKLGSLSTYTKVYYKLFIQQISQFNNLFNCVNKTDYSMLRGNVNPAIGSGKMSLTTIDLDESKIFELEHQNEIDFNYSNYCKNQDQVFDNSKKCFVFIFIISVFSCMLAMPNYYAFEVKNNTVTVSPTRMPTVTNEELKAILNNIYFIKDEVMPTNPNYHRNSSQQQATSLLYSINMAKAYGLNLIITNQQMRVLSRIRRTYDKFFNVTGAFDLASKHYRLCNTLENKRVWKKPPKKTNSPDYVANSKPVDVENYLHKIRILNLSLVCVKKNDWNGFLAYNTLYFWLEHTIVVAMPISINLVVAVTMANTFWRCTRYLQQQARVANKRRHINHCLSELCVQQQQFLSQSQSSRIHSGKRQVSASRQGSNSLLKPGSVGNRPKCVQIQDQTDVISTDYDDDVFYEPNSCHKETATQIEIEQRIHKNQTDYNTLNLMFLIDLGIYVCIGFPYTLMRLALDLFVKDRIKINLDFFILYNFTFLAFHLHLVSKLFLLSACSVKFRLSLASLFGINPAYCWVPQESLTELNSSSGDVPVCCGASLTKGSEQGEFFNVVLHTKEASNYEAHPRLQTTQLQTDIVFALDDDNLIRTNV